MLPFQRALCGDEMLSSGSDGKERPLIPAISILSWMMPDGVMPEKGSTIFFSGPAVNAPEAPCWQSPSDQCLGNRRNSAEPGPAENNQWEKTHDSFWRPEVEKPNKTQKRKSAFSCFSARDGKTDSSDLAVHRNEKKEPCAAHRNILSEFRFPAPGTEGVMAKLVSGPG